MKLPFVSRKKYKKALRDASDLRSRNNTLSREFETAERFNKEVIPRLIRIKVQEDLKYQTYRVCAEFHRDMVERGFTHGADSEMICHLAHRVSLEIERKIIQYNFARCDL